MRRKHSLNHELRHSKIIVRSADDMNYGSIEPTSFILGLMAQTGNWRSLIAGMPRLPRLPTYLLFACSITWGLSFSLNKIAITSGIPVSYVFWQNPGAAQAVEAQPYADVVRISIARCGN